MESEGLAPRRQRQRRVDDRDRQRAAKACDSCRRMKEKCDGGVPCSRCIRVRKRCAFTDSVLTRRPGAEKYVPSGNPPDSPSDGETADLKQRLQYMEKLVSKYVGDVDMDIEALGRLAEETDRDQTPPKPATELSHDSEDLGPRPEITVQPLENNMTHYSGEFSHWNFAMRIKQWIDQNASHQNQKDGTQSSQCKDAFRAVELEVSAGAVESLSSLPPPFVANFLTQAFFHHAESNYFYVEREWFLSKLEMAYGSPGSITHRDVPTICIILMVLAIGTQYAYLDSPSSSSEASEATEPASFSEDTIGIMLYRKASELVPDVMTIASLESVQACLLLGMYTQPLDTSGLSYIYLNLAVKLAIQNGMHRKYPGDSLDPTVRETRTRVWWTTYTTERRVGIFHGRPISVSPDDVDAEMPSDCSDQGVFTSSAHLSAVQTTIKLHQTLANISQEISSLKKVYTKSHLTGTLGRLVLLSNDLASWWQGLPYATAYSSPEMLSEVSRSDMHLNLEYCLVRIFAGRPFISLQSSKQKTPTSSSPSKGSGRSGATPIASEIDLKYTLVADGVAAALLVVDILQLLRDNIGLARTSYTEFSSCRAALLIIIAQCLKEKSTRLRQALRDGIVMMRFMSAGSESSRSDASLIEAFQRAIVQLDASDSGPHQATESSYARFKQWESLWKNNSSHDAQSGFAAVPTNSSSEAAIQKTSSWSLPTAAPLTDFSAMDWSFASVPQTMDEFSSMFGFGAPPESTLSPEDRGSGSASWIGHQSWQ